MVVTKAHSFSIDPSKIHLSKTILTPEILTTSFSSFVAKFVFGLWHDIPFQSVVSKPYKGLSHFIQFVHDILKSTSLPFSVVLLGIKYIHRLRISRPELTGAPGSECRLIVCALMLAMKELCDNTYSNRSWKKISGIPLKEINQTEVLIHFILYSYPIIDGILIANPFQSLRFTFGIL